MHKLDFNIDPDCLKFARSKHKKHQTYGQQDKSLDSNQTIWNFHSYVFSLRQLFTLGNSRLRSLGNHFSFINNITYKLCALKANKENFLES